jgi:hypothetical protein
MASVRKRTWNTAAGEPRSAWVADYFDQNRKRHEKAFPTQRAAKAWLVETQGEVARGVRTPERHLITVAEAAQTWLERGRVEKLERSTLRGYAASVRLYIASDDSGIGAVKLAQLSTPMLEGWRDCLLAKMSRRTARKVLPASLGGTAQIFGRDDATGARTRATPAFPFCTTGGLGLLRKL